MKRVVIFGAWKEGISLFFKIHDTANIVAFLDNNIQKQGEKIYGIEIFAPKMLLQIEFDEIYVCSVSNKIQMYNQLIKLGVRKEAIKIPFLTEIRRDQFRNCDLYVNCKDHEFEIRWRKLKEGYQRVILYRLDFSCIGEIIIRLSHVFEDEERTGASTLRVFFPVIGSKRRICNRELLSLIRNRIYIIMEESIDFWAYILDTHSDEIDIIDYNRYIYRDEFPVRLIQSNYIMVKFRDDQITYGKRKLLEMGIDETYVCLAARSSNYARDTLKDEEQMNSNIALHKFRNSDFLKYKDVIDYFKTLNIQTVRMGRGEKTISAIENCVDYAGLYANDFMDIFLMANCKFVICGGGSGIYTMATMFGRPVLFVNIVPITLGCGGEYYTDDDLYIPKKMLHKNKYLSLREMAVYENQCFTNSQKYDELGIEFVDNSAEEILEAAKEMLLRMDGGWINTDEDVVIEQKYNVILSDVNEMAKRNVYNWVGEAMPRRISCNYLKNNLYLLE